ncbi:unnamed protein product [Ectocarpus sp. 12 AP-2014]
MKNRVRALLLGFVPCFGEAFVPTTPLATTYSHPSMRATMSMKQPGTPLRSRIERAAVAAAVATSVAILSTASVPAALAEDLPPGTNPFTSICMGFGCGEFQGLDYPGAPAPTDEDSITFKSFLQSLDKGLVTKVDFLAGGEKAYAFVKPDAAGEATRIRVGEGYPDEQGKGWSSPLWVVRALNDRNVPYHFEYNLGKGRATQAVAK